MGYHGLSWVTDLVGSWYDSKKSFAFSNASLWYSLVLSLVIFSDLRTYENTVFTIYMEVSFSNFGQIVHMLYINLTDVLYCKHIMVCLNP